MAYGSEGLKSVVVREVKCHNDSRPVDFKGHVVIESVVVIGEEGGDRNFAPKELEGPVTMDQRGARAHT